MIELQKQQQLNAHKRLATGLFLLMLLVYIAMEWLGNKQAVNWIGYIKAFAEAAMVGALADWFAVTALFHHPLGIPIPHTNLIENSKASIGENLGDFVVKNFLNATTLRPYINQIKISGFVANWLEKEKNKTALLKELLGLGRDILQKVDDQNIAHFLALKGSELLDDIKLNRLIGNAGSYFLEQGEHQQLITTLATKIGGYIQENEALVRDKVKGESYFFIPGFVEDQLASKITSGLVAYFDEIACDPKHRVRAEISSQLFSFLNQLSTEPKWELEFREMTQKFLTPEKIETYALSAWKSLKTSINEGLTHENSGLNNYLSNLLNEQVQHLKSSLELQMKIDGWIRHTAYKYILRNTTQVGKLISNTVGNWQGRELSRKLELEVGKDLQFIRINGTLVGGLVGLLIYSITKIIGAI